MIAAALIISSSELGSRKLTLGRIKERIFCHLNETKLKLWEGTAFTAEPKKEDIPQTKIKIIERCLTAQLAE